MKRYEKPAISVISLQLKENIAAVPTTVYKGNATGGVSEGALVSIALSEVGSGLPAGGIVTPS